MLVDVREAPIERITSKGVKTADAEYELDVIIFATGFDAITGALTRIDIRGVGGQAVKDKLAAGPRHYMGILSAGFPNMFTINQAGSGNYPRGAEWIVEWVSDCLSYMRDNRFSRIEASLEAEDAWVDYVVKGTANTLRTKARDLVANRNQHSGQSKRSAKQQSGQCSGIPSQADRGGSQGLRRVCVSVTPVG